MRKSIFDAASHFTDQVMVSIERVLSEVITMSFVNNRNIIHLRISRPLALVPRADAEPQDWRDLEASDRILSLRFC